jgi:hypothetical protein
MRFLLFSLLIMLNLAAWGQFKYDSKKKVNFAAVPVINYDRDNWRILAAAGLGTAVRSLDELSEASALPGAGVGFRFMAIPKERINIGFDVAAGIDNWGIYFRIGEAFGKEHKEGWSGVRRGNGDSIPS